MPAPNEPKNPNLPPENRESAPNSRDETLENAAQNAAHSNFSGANFADASVVISAQHTIPPNENATFSDDENVILANDEINSVLETPISANQNAANSDEMAESSARDDLENALPANANSTNAFPAKENSSSENLSQNDVSKLAFPSVAEVREAARVLKSRGSKKRERRAAAAVMSRVGASKGGKNRALKLSPEKRREIATLGGLARQDKARQNRKKPRKTRS